MQSCLFVLGIRVYTWAVSIRVFGMIKRWRLLKASEEDALLEFACEIYDPASVFFGFGPQSTWKASCTWLRAGSYHVIKAALLFYYASRKSIMTMDSTITNFRRDKIDYIYFVKIRRKKQWTMWDGYNWGCGFKKFNVLCKNMRMGWTKKWSLHF